MVQPQWTQPVQPMGDWSGAAAAPEVYHQMHNHTAAQQSPAMYDQQQYMHIPFQDTANPMMIPIGKVIFEFMVAITVAASLMATVNTGCINIKWLK